MIPAPPDIVICFPPAGAGPSFYQNLIALSQQLQIHAIDLPGKEKRCTEPAPQTVEAIIAVCANDLEKLSADAAHVVLFGHCFGAYLALEAARLLSTINTNITLVVSGSPPPGIRTWDDYSSAPQQEFIDSMAALAGRRNPALDNPELCDFLLPLMRIDVAAHESYRPQTPINLKHPIIVLRGSEDEAVSAEQAQLWKTLTKDECQIQEIPGDHMYLVDNAKSLVAVLEEMLCPRNES